MPNKGKFYLGIDLGGTEVKIAITDENGGIIDQKNVRNSADSTPEAIIGAIITQTRSMKDLKRVSGTGVGVAGDIDQEKGVVRFSPNLPKWKNVRLKKMLKASLPQPIVIDNDANAAAWGAYWLDAKGEAKNLICVTLGTGVGGGLILDEKLYKGSSGSAGEIGHISLNPFGLKCNCGNTGCLERYVGSKYLSEQGREAVKMGKSTILSRLVNGKLDEITPLILHRAAMMGDKAAKRIWEITGERLGIVLAGVINLINPEIIVLAGGVSKADDLLLKPIRKTIRLRAFTKPAQSCKIIISKYTQKLGVVGAAFLVR